MKKETTLKDRADALNIILSDTDADFSISYESIPKNNTTRDAFVLRPKADGMLAPTVYLDDVPMKMSDEGLAEWFMDLYRQHSVLAPNLDVVLSKERILDTVRMKLVSADNAARMDKRHVVYETMMNLLICYFMPVDWLSNDDGIASIAITEDILERTGLSMDDLKTASLKNMKGIADIVSMTEMLRSLTGNDCMTLDDCAAPIWVVTNNERFFGAASIMLETVQQALQDKLGSCFYILPSSVHECLAVSATADTDAIELAKMVREINESCVALEDRLQDSVYIFKDGELSVAA